MEFEIVNVVTTADLRQKVDIVSLGMHDEFHHDETTYGGRVAYHDIPDEPGKVTIFHSGKMISVGTGSIEASKRLLSITKDSLIRKGYILDVELETQVRNIVCLIKTGHTVNLESLVGLTGCSYEPEQFPGAVLKTTEPTECTLLFFSSGKVVITGLKRIESINDIIMYINGLVSDL